MFIRNPSPEPLASEIVEALSAVQTSTLGHLRDHGFPAGLNPLQRPLKFVGPAYTVRLPHLDSTALHVAVDEIRSGDVLVVDQSGDTRSCFGGMVAFTAHARGAAGAIIAGAINDVDEIKSLGFPVFSSGVSARTTRIQGIEGSINVPVSVGGVSIMPGDVVVADSDGIAIISREEALEIAAVLKAKEEAEPALQDRIADGSRLSEATGALNYFETATVSAG